MLRFYASGISHQKTLQLYFIVSRSIYSNIDLYLIVMNWLSPIVLFFRRFILIFAIMWIHIIILLSFESEQKSFQICSSSNEFRFSIFFILYKLLSAENYRYHNPVALQVYSKFSCITKTNLKTSQTTLTCSNLSIYYHAKRVYTNCFGSRNFDLSWHCSLDPI